MATTTTSRRAVLAGLAAAPAAAVPALAAAHPDAELFAAFERFQAAAVAADVANADAALDQSRMSEDELEAAFVRHSRAFEEVLTYQPTTLAGCAAMLRCLQSWGDHNEDALLSGWYGPVSGPAETLLARLANVIDQQAGKAVQS
jgi:hypothetical protein